MNLITGGTGPHAGQPIVTAGAPAEDAAGALILVHGRGGNAPDMLGLARLLVGSDVACLAPQAAGNSWYPNRFIEPVMRNEPHLGSALSVLGDLVDRLLDGGLPAERIALLGFSQGACLSLEFAFRRRHRLGAVIGFSGGLIGEGIAAPDTSGMPFAGMPVLLGCSDRDPHIPIGRVHETDAAMRALGADVVTRVYPGGAHDINADEMTIARQMLACLGSSIA